MSGQLKTLSFTLIIIFVGLSASSQTNANYFAIKYIKVDPSVESEYLRLELEVWKKIHQARVKEGVLDGWYLFRIVSPAGTSAKYNYLTIEAYNGSEKLAGHFDGYGVDYTGILSPDDIALALRTPEIKDMIYEEVWRTVDEVLNLNSGDMYRYQIFNSMKLRPGTEESDYQRMEQTYWKPMHQERMKRGTMKGWGLYTMIIPGGTERDYHWATVDFYDDFINYLEPTTPILESVHGETSAQKYIKETTEKRDLLKAEIRELVDFVNPSSGSSSN